MREMAYLFVVLFVLFGILTIFAVVGNNSGVAWLAVYGSLLSGVMAACLLGNSTKVDLS